MSGHRKCPTAKTLGTNTRTLGNATEADAGTIRGTQNRVSRSPESLNQAYENAAETRLKSKVDSRSRRLCPGRRFATVFGLAR